MFAKFWQPEKVKTRLAAVIGASAAAAIHQASVATLLRRLQSMADRRWIVYAPATCGAEFQQLVERTTGGNWELHPQSVGDLGQRMRRFLDAGFEQGATDILLIGSDSPTMPTRVLMSAWTDLQTHDVVLGPADDGGYYLIGARNATPPIFEGIDWSSPRVWQQTVQRLERLERKGRTWKALPAGYDVDRIDDLKRLSRELATVGFQNPIWDDLRQSVARALHDV